MMTEIIKLIYLIIIFHFCLFIPGYLISRKSDLSDVIKLVNSISLSIFIIFLVSFVLYVFELEAIVYVLFSLCLVVATVWMRKELFAFFRSPPVKPLVRYYGIFILWVFLLTTVIKHYSGGGWFGDWDEHYQRSLFFRDLYPLDTVFTGGWLLTARPPLHNVVASFFLNHVGNQFYYYQAASVLLNAVVFFGAYVVFAVYMKERGSDVSVGVPILALFLSLNPSVLVNVTYSWTRALTNFFVLYSLALFYLSAKKNDNYLRRLSYVNMGLAVLTHYSAVPFLMGLMLIDLYSVLRGQLAMKRAVINVGIFLAVISPWFAFALYHYGLRITFGSNSTVLDSSALGTWENLLKIWKNITSTILPHFLRHVPELYQQKHLLGYIRDYAFLVYQVNFLFMLGSIGWLIVLISFVKGSVFSFMNGEREEPLLLWSFFILVITMGIAVHGSYDAFGVGHICLQPLAILGVVYLAANFQEYNKYIKVLLCGGLFIDSLFGVLLQFWMQHYGFSDVVAINRYDFVLGQSVTNNVIYKAERGYDFIADLNYSAFITVSLSIILIAWIICLIGFHQSRLKRINADEARSIF